MQELVSVVMSVYNCESVVAETIESVLGQTYLNLEFIIVDDASTDDTLQICKLYAQKDKRIMVIHRNSNDHIAALNEGIRCAKGKYIARMDGDDIWDLQKLEKQMSYLKYHPEYQIVGCYYDVFGNSINMESHRESAKMYSASTEDLERFLIGEGKTIAQPSLIYEKKILEKIGGYRYLNQYSEDYDLLVRVMMLGVKIYNYPEYLLHVRRTDNSKSLSSSRALEDAINVRYQYIKQTVGIEGKNIVIWGTGLGGGVVYEMLAREPLNIIGFGDNYKQGIFKELKIYNIEQIKDLNIDYIFIANTNGKLDVIKQLSENGFDIIHDYCALV